MIYETKNAITQRLNCEGNGLPCTYRTKMNLLSAGLKKKALKNITEIFATDPPQTAPIPPTPTTIRRF